MTYLVTPKHKNLRPGSHEIYKFSRPFLGHHYYIHVLSLSDLWPGDEKKIYKEIIHFHYIIYMATPYHKKLCPIGARNLQPSLVIITNYSVCLIYA